MFSSIQLRTILFLDSSLLHQFVLFNLVLSMCQKNLSKMKLQSNQPDHKGRSKLIRCYVQN